VRQAADLRLTMRSRRVACLAKPCIIKRGDRARERDDARLVVKRMVIKSVLG